MRGNRRIVVLWCMLVLASLALAGNGLSGGGLSGGGINPNTVTSATAPLVDTAGVISCTAAGAGQSGCLTNSGGVLALDAGLSVVGTVTATTLSSNQTGSGDGVTVPAGTRIKYGAPSGYIAYESSIEVFGARIQVPNSTGIVAASLGYSTPVASGSVAYSSITGAKTCMGTGNVGCLTYTATGPSILTSVGFGVGTAMSISSTAPTITSGFGTNPSISSSNGTLAFRITIGSGGTGSSGVLALPAVATGWNCMFSDLSTPGLNVTKQNGVGTTTAVTVTNYVSSTGIETAWTAGDVVGAVCAGI